MSLIVRVRIVYIKFELTLVRLCKSRKCRGAGIAADRFLVQPAVVCVRTLVGLAALDNSKQPTSMRACSEAFALNVQLL